MRRVQDVPVGKKDNALKKGYLVLLRGIIRAYVEIFRGTPMIFRRCLSITALPYFTNNRRTVAERLARGVRSRRPSTRAHMAETVRGGILSVDPGQTEGAKAIA
jgi:putative lysine transport system permease protein